MSGKFTIDEILGTGGEESDASRLNLSDRNVAPLSDGNEQNGGARATASNRKTSAPAPNRGLSEELEIKLLAEQMHELGYHPVILFGSSNSGKTSMLLSLFAAATTRVELQTAIQLNHNILSASSDYGDYLRRSSQDFFHSKLTNFIEGRAAAETNVPLPFFIPFDFTSSNGETVRIAFMEGNGEWFHPTRTDDGAILSADLNPAIEQFVKSFLGGISFIYLLPYTQRESGHADGYSVDEDLAKKNAGLAVKGVIEQYRQIREGSTSQDRHLMLVTKWDARFDAKNTSGDKLYDVLTEDIDEVKYYLDNSINYRSAVVAFQGLADVKAKNVRNYCAGRMKGKEVDWPHRDHDFYDAISQFPIELWKWIYSGAFGIEQANPFPQVKERHPLLRKLYNLITKLIG